MLGRGGEHMSMRMRWWVSTASVVMSVAHRRYLRGCSGAVWRAGTR
jgi:hypothetical protein